MCTFINTLPKRSKTAGTAKKKSLVLSMKLCPDTPDGKKTWYRFRLLNFAAKGTDRDYPFIERFVHQHWGKNEKGYSIIEDEVVCPVTNWVDWEGDRYDCPICKYANQQFLILQESKYKDAEARKKNNEFGRKYQAIIPVYVVNDPNYEGNNGRFKVIIINDKKLYKVFDEKVRTQLTKANCFNGVNAVDCCIHIGQASEVRNEGKPNEYVYKHNVIDKITFSSEPKNIAAITKDAVDTLMPFDLTYYQSSTREELQAFYEKYAKVSNDDIVDEDDELNVFDSPKSEVVQNTNNISNTTIQNEKTENDDISDEDANTLVENDLETDSDDLPDVSEKTIVESANNDISDIKEKEAEALLDGLQFSN